MNNHLDTVRLVIVDFISTIFFFHACNVFRENFRDKNQLKPALSHVCVCVLKSFFPDRIATIEVPVVCPQSVRY